MREVREGKSFKCVMRRYCRAVSRQNWILRDVVSGGNEHVGMEEFVLINTQETIHSIC